VRTPELAKIFVEQHPQAAVIFLIALVATVLAALWARAIDREEQRFDPESGKFVRSGFHCDRDD
jgi:hypothetical protein